jgi:transcriptional regulator with XRE-family HTH domain
MSKINIGQNIRLLRGTASMSQVELANKVGLSQAQIQRLEAGDRSLKIETLEKIAAALCVDLSEVIFKSQPFPYRHIPIRGFVNAGAPMVVFDDITDYETVAFDTDRGDFFALKVQGESMNRVAPNNSIIIVDPKEIEPEKLHRQPVVAFQDGEVLFKMWDQNAKTFRPNSSIENEFDLIPAKYGMKILGKVLAFIVRL